MDPQIHCHVYTYADGGGWLLTDYSQWVNLSEEMS